MTITVEATFENGAFKPTKPIALAEGTHVRLSITNVDGDYDPLDEVVGICEEGPEISLAERHDEIVGGEVHRKDCDAS